MIRLSFWELIRQSCILNSLVRLDHQLVSADGQSDWLDPLLKCFQSSQFLDAWPGFLVKQDKEMHSQELWPCFSVSWGSG